MTAIKECMATRYYDFLASKISSKKSTVKYASFYNESESRATITTTTTKKTTATMTNVNGERYEQPIRIGAKDNDAPELQEGRQDKISSQEGILLHCRRPIQGALTNVVEDVLADRDSSQILTVASEHVLLAVRVTAKTGAMQWKGYISNSTLERHCRINSGVREAQQKAGEGYVTFRSQ